MGNLVTPHTQLASHPASNDAPIVFTPEEEQKYAAQWALADEIQYGVMPDPELNEVGWMQRVHHRLTAFLVKHNHVNETRAKTVTDEIKAIIRERQHYDVDYAFELAKLEVGKNRIGQMATKTKPAPTKAPDDTDAKVTILLSRLNGVDKKYHRENEDNSVLRYMLCDGYPKVKSVIDLVRLPDYSVDEAEQRYDIIVANHTTPPERMTLDEIDKSIEAMPPTVANDLPKTDLAASISPDEELPDADAGLNVWFARTTETVKATEQKPPHWSLDNKARGKFWADVNSRFNKYEQSRVLDIHARNAYVHAVLGFDSISKTYLSQDEATVRICAAIDAEYSPKTENHTPPSHDDPVSLPVDPTPPVGVHSPEPKSTETPQTAPPLNEGKNHHMEAPVIAYTTIIINDHRVNVTAREGATAEQVHDTVIALINGLRLIAADDTIKSYAAVIDNRDRTIRMKGEVKAAESAPATTPAANGNGNGHATDGGTVGCAMIEVGTARKTGNPQLNFACDGMNFPIHYSLPVGDMVNLLSKVKQASGQPFTAADLTPNRKFGGAWRVVWEPSKSDPKYKNVVEVLPA